MSTTGEKWTEVDQTDSKEAFGEDDKHDKWQLTRKYHLKTLGNYKLKQK